MESRKMAFLGFKMEENLSHYHTIQLNIKVRQFRAQAVNIVIFLSSLNYVSIQAEEKNYIYNSFSLSLP